MTARQFAEAIGRSKDTAARRLNALAEARYAAKDESARPYEWSPVSTL